MVNGKEYRFLGLTVMATQWILISMLQRQLKQGPLIIDTLTSLPFSGSAMLQSKKEDIRAAIVTVLVYLGLCSSYCGDCRYGVFLLIAAPVCFYCV